MAKKSLSGILEIIVETIIVKSRWVLAPLYLGLILLVLLLVVKFFQQFWILLRDFDALSSTALIVNLLSLLDIVLIANLVVMVMFAGYENFVSRLDAVLNDDQLDRPSWLGRVSFSDIKLNIIGAIVAISTIELLKIFLDVVNISDRQAIIMVAIHLTFAVSGVLFALMEKLKHGSGRSNPPPPHNDSHGDSHGDSP